MSDRLPSSTLLILLVISQPACVDYGPIDRQISTENLPQKVSKALQSNLALSERVVSIVERRHRGRMVGYTITTKDVSTGRLKQLHYRPSTEQFAIVEPPPVLPESQ